MKVFFFDLQHLLLFWCEYNTEFKHWLFKIAHFSISAVYTLCIWIFCINRISKTLYRAKHWNALHLIWLHCQCDVACAQFSRMNKDIGYMGEKPECSGLLGDKLKESFITSPTLLQSTDQWALERSQRSGRRLHQSTNQMNRWLTAWHYWYQYCMCLFVYL